MVSKSFSCIFLLITIKSLLAYAEDVVLVDIPNYGKVIGLQQYHKYDRFYSFESIPYAKPPLGKLRFKAPEKVEPWSGIIDGTVHAPMCPQFNFGQLMGQEDCLYLNIYTPDLQPKAKLPVMVFIHGGAYMIGSGSGEVLGPEFLMSKEVVLVTINYRLGYLGALSFKDQSQGVPGNAHMKDQVMALKWINENIKYFGGGQNITIFGESVGGASVHFHLVTPMSQGLFNKAIAQSGTALNPWAYGILGTGDTLAEKLEIKGKDTKDVIEQMQSIPLEAFMMKTMAQKELSINVHALHEFSPVVETQTNEPVFLPKPVTQLIQENNFNKVPFLIGYNNNETLLFQVLTHLQTGHQDPLGEIRNLIPHDLKIPESELESILGKIKSTYFPEEGDQENVDHYTKFTLGPLFLTGIIQTIQEHLRVQHSNIFLYLFSTDLKLNFFKRLHPVTAMYKGASHADELGYLFTTQQTPCVPSDTPEEKAVLETTEIWSHFAKEGDLKSYNDQWTSLALTEPMVYPYGDINGDKVKVRLNPDPVTWNFWSSLYDKYSSKLQ